MLSVLLLKRLSYETEKFLPESQAGFRKGRACRDNITVLRWAIDAALAAGQQLTISFIDFKAAFDTVSHKLLDEALAAAGASSKSRAMFRAIYSKASGRVRVRRPGGGQPDHPHTSSELCLFSSGLIRDAWEQGLGLQLHAPILCVKEGML